jgi:hypothetical protein
VQVVHSGCLPAGERLSALEVSWCVHAQRMEDEGPGGKTQHTLSGEDIRGGIKSTWQ